MSKIELTAKAWNDIVFEGRNKNYGAYDMRNNSNRRHIIALIIVVLVALIGFYLPSFIKMVTPEQDEAFTETTALAEYVEPVEEEEIEEIIIPPEVQEQQEVQAMVQNTEPVIVPPDEVTNEMRNQEDLLDDKAKMGTENVEGTYTADTVKAPPAPPAPVVDDEVYDIVEQMPSYPGGEAAMMAFINKEMVYPQAAIDGKVQGRVFVSFVVQKDGSIANVKIDKPGDYSLDDEALRVIKRMPKWIAGKQNGNAVKVKVIVPITFRLKQRR